MPRSDCIFPAYSELPPAREPHALPVPCDKKRETQSLLQSRESLPQRQIFERRPDLLSPRRRSGERNEERGSLPGNLLSPALSSISMEERE